MRILVLGGTAFLSAEIARQAVEAGHEVTCLARGSSTSPPDGVTWVRSDRAAGATAFAEIDGRWDEVVDVSRDPVQARVALDVLGPSAAHWTFVSSCSVYADHSMPDADENAALLEPLPEGQAGTPETYGESKSAIEQMTLAAVGGEKAHIVRAGLIGGAGGTAPTDTVIGLPDSLRTLTRYWSRTSRTTPRRSLMSGTLRRGSCSPRRKG